MISQEDQGARHQNAEEQTLFCPLLMQELTQEERRGGGFWLPTNVSFVFSQTPALLS